MSIVNNFTPFLYAFLFLSSFLSTPFSIIFQLIFHFLNFSLLVGLILYDWGRRRYKGEGRKAGASSLKERLSNLFLFCDAGFIHIGILAMLALFTMHVQVATRFLVANCPFIMVYAVRFKGWRLWCIVVYFAVYSVAGLVVHTTFYPWT